MNALAAAAIASALGAPLATIRAGLEAAPRLRGVSCGESTRRARSSSTTATTRIPARSRPRIATLATERGDTILVMGDMAELGADAERLHAHIGALAKASGIHHLRAVGKLSRAAVEAFGTARCTSRIRPR